MAERGSLVPLGHRLGTGTDCTRLHSIHTNHLQQFGNDGLGLSDEYALSLAPINLRKPGPSVGLVNSAAVQLQKNYKSWKKRQEFLIICRGIVKIQANQYLQALAPEFDCLLFDLDDTLYPRSSGLLQQCAKNIEEFMIEKLGIDEAKVPEMNRILYRNYGTSMAGLHAIGYDFDDDHYHSYVHGRLPYQNLKPDYVLRSLLLSLPIRKVIFSNADKAHIAETLSILGLEDCFDMVVCFETLNPNSVKISNGIERPRKDVIFNADAELPETPTVCKPFENAFQQAFKIANINPLRTLYFEDSIRNLETGEQLGMHTVLVGCSERPKGVDYAVESIHNIREAIPDLWENRARSGKKSYSGTRQIETSVIA